MSEQPGTSDDKLKSLEDLKNNLTRDELLNYTETFKLFDADGDGEINVADFTSIFEKVNGRRLSNAQAQKMINEADITRTGTLSFLEFLNIMSIQRKENRDEDEEMIQIFKIFDQDKDGFVTAKDLRQSFSDFGENFEEERIEAMIREADQDGDGKLSIDEFSFLFRNKDFDPEEFDMRI